MPSQRIEIEKTEGKDFDKDREEGDKPLETLSKGQRVEYSTMCKMVEAKRAPWFLATNAKFRR